MKVLVTGANGFLGFHLVESLLRAGLPVVATSKGACRLPFTGHRLFTYASLDFTREKDVHLLMEKIRPDIVVHAGALSKPDACEQNRELAYEVNVMGTSHLLKAASGTGGHFIFLSTDFVFSGEKGMYREEDPTGPVNYYGETKCQAENLVKAYVPGWSIVRTVLVYGPVKDDRKNLPLLIADKLRNGEPYAVVNDQVRTPTFVRDLAGAIVTIAKKKAGGIWHISGNDILTPYQMALKTAEWLGLDTHLLKEVNASLFPEPARRPLVTGFCTDKAREKLGFIPTPFEEGLRLTFGDQK